MQYIESMQEDVILLQSKGHLMDTDR